MDRAGDRRRGHARACLISDLLYPGSDASAFVARSERLVEGGRSGDP